MAYCSACDREVRVVLKPDYREGVRPSAHDPAAVVCLEHGEACTGSMCPLFGVPTEQMRENLRILDEEEP